jgi:ubiquinone/menaquinone biosynthesis C-methylase UbiE
MGPRPWTAEDFLALGASDFRDILRHWRHFGLVDAACVEIGCGAGRMTAQLIEAFKEVVALDVSLDQIALARDLLGPEARRVHFYQVREPSIPMPDASCSAMFSCHVFQHLSSFAAVMEYLRESFRVIAPGGTICFHIPVPGAHRGAARSGLRLGLYNLSVTLRRALGARLIMEYHRYSASTIFQTLHAIGFREAELRVFDMRSNGDPHSFFFAHRP